MLSQIYAETNFSFWHRGQHRTLPTQRGIRQGCKAAPILWASFAAWILEMAAHAHGWDWIRQVITAYADDFCLHCLLNSSMEVHDAIAKVGAFLDLHNGWPDDQQGQNNCTFEAAWTWEGQDLQTLYQTNQRRALHLYP